MGHEYIAGHRAYRQLAARLCRAGFHVLRFDFYGCGDSAGDSSQGHVSRWLEDIATAVAEIRKRSEVAKLCLVGLRLGGSLAMMAAAQRNDIDAIALWDPVVDGKSYIRELMSAHQEMLRQDYLQGEGVGTEEEATEILGFPLTDLMRAELAEVNLLATKTKPANRMLVIESNREPVWTQLREHLQSLHAGCEFKQVPGPQLWKEDMNRVLVPSPILDAVVSWLSGVQR
jgi:pimeloyl-ACP methyl ester carboxylesterase